jgi:hypothetical protein
VQVWHVEPHVVTEFATQALLQKFGVTEEPHCRPQLVPSQVTVVPLPGGPAGHGVQREPQVLTLKFHTHWPLHSWYPVLQRMPQLVPSQVATPKDVVGQAVQRVPHEATLVSGTHWVPHW